jgi:hypothetical protein
MLQYTINYFGFQADKKKRLLTGGRHTCPVQAFETEEFNHLI